MKTLTKSGMLVAALTIAPLSSHAFMCGSVGKGYGPGPGYMKHGYHYNHAGYGHPRMMPGRYYGGQPGYGRPGYARHGHHGMQAQNQYGAPYGQAGYPGQQAYPAATYAAATSASPAVQSDAQGDTGTSVAISGMQFQPATIKVKSGESVTWFNNSNMPHTVTGTSGSGLASQTMGNGGAFAHTFSEPGTYTYVCALHPSMTGTVIVE